MLARQTALAHEDHKAPRAVAALLDLAAVGVENAIAEVGIRRCRRLDDEHLIATDAEAAIGERADLRRRQRERLSRRVYDDEVVAEPLHFGEAQRRHDGAAYTLNRKCMTSPSLTT